MVEMKNTMTTAANKLQVLTSNDWKIAIFLRHLKKKQKKKRGGEKHLMPGFCSRSELL